MSTPMMRLIALTVLIANLAVLAYGQGFFGVAPAEKGRNPQLLNQRNQQAVTPGTPR